MNLKKPPYRNRGKTDILSKLKLATLGYNQLYRGKNRGGPQLRAIDLTLDKSRTRLATNARDSLTLIVDIGT